MPSYGIAYLLKGQAGEMIQKMKDELQPGNIPVHVTLGMGVVEKPADEVARLVADLARTQAPVPINLHGSAHFLPISNTSFLEVALSPELMNLHDAVNKFMGWSDSYSFVPHCTMTMGKSPEEIKAAAEWLSSRNVRIQDTIDTLSLFIVYTPGEWEIVGKVVMEG